MLTPERREELAVEIRERAIAWSTGQADVDEIDTINILQATMLAMRRAVEALSITPEEALVDGNRCPDLACRVHAIVKGDRDVASISAASIIAKTTRDAMLRELDSVYPVYGFAQHKGYGTPEHLAALDSTGRARSIGDRSRRCCKASWISISRRHPMRPFRVLAASVALLAALLIGSTVAIAQVRVGSKNFTEQFVVAEIYAQALEAAGIKVERKINLGGTLIAHKALEEKQIDLYPEYTGTMLLVVLKAEPMTDRKAVYDKVKADYAAQGPRRAQRSADEQHVQHGRAPGNGRAVQARDAVRPRQVAKELKLGAGPEFRDRKDGLPGLKAKYGMEFKEDLQMAIGLRYQALSNKQIDVVNGYATDGMISALKLKRLKDDKNLWPPYYLVPVVRKDALDANPKIAEVLNRVNAMLDEATMAELNYKVDGEKQEPKDVARAFLKTKGIVR